MTCGSCTECSCSQESPSSGSESTVDLKAGFEPSYWIAAPEEWEAQAPLYRVTRFHKGDDGGFKEASVPLRSLKSVIENFAKGDDLYGIWVCRL